MDEANRSEASPSTDPATTEGAPEPPAQETFVDARMSDVHLLPALKWAALHAELQSPKTVPSLGRAISRNLARAFAFQMYGIHPSASLRFGRDPCWSKRLRGSSGHIIKSIRVLHAVLSAARVQPLSRQRHRRRDLAYRGGTMVRRPRRGVVRDTNDRLECHRKRGVVDVRPIGVIYPRGPSWA